MSTEDAYQTRGRDRSILRIKNSRVGQPIEPDYSPHLLAISERGRIDPRFIRGDGTENRNPKDISLSKLVAEDFRTHGRDWHSAGFWTLFWHRFGNWRMDVRPRILRLPLSMLYRSMERRCQYRYGIMLPYTVRVGRRVKMEHFGSMIIVAQQIGDDVVLRHNTTIGIARENQPEDRPVLESGVNIGAGAVLLGAILIGRNAVVGANAVVTKDIPAGATVGGIPARIISSKADI